MPKPKWPAITVACLLLIALLAGASYFAGVTAPESYPRMSSLNSGPEGARLLFDSLANTHSLTVSRNYLPFSQWRPRSATILLLSLPASDLNFASKEDLLELEMLAQANNRVVLCIPDDSLAAQQENKKETPKPPVIKSRWGIQIYAKKADKGKKESDPDLILDADSSWRPVNGLDDAVEKHFGKEGAIVVALHGDDLSNEIFATDADVLDEVPPLIGQHASVVFDETHLGIEESGSVAGLARRYKLQGLVAGLLIVVVLFIWNQSVSFPPPTHFESSQDKRVAGADARSTFASLIARHLTPRDLIEGCIAEWNRLKPQQRINSELPAKIDPVATYRQLQESLAKKRKPI